MDTPPTVDNSMSEFDQDILRVTSIQSDRTQDINKIVKTCYTTLVESYAADPTRKSFLFSDFFLRRNHVEGNFVLTKTYTDPESLGLIIAGIHEKTGSSVVCDTEYVGFDANGVPNCIKCRYMKNDTPPELEFQEQSAHQKDISSIVASCYSALIRADASKEPCVFKGTHLSRDHVDIDDGDRVTHEYSDRDSLDLIIAGIHEETSKIPLKVKCVKSNSHIPFLSFMKADCIKCRFA